MKIYFALALTIIPLVAFSQTRKDFTYAGNEKVEYIIDDSPATFNISMEDKLEVYSKAEEKLYSSYAEAADGIRYGLLPSFEQIQYIGKYSDDRIYATLELALESEKAEILEVIAPVLDGEALSFICTALVLSGKKDVCPEKMRAGAIKAAENFIKNEPLRSKPIGFYTWNNQLGKFFTRDRWLQKPFNTKDPKQLKVAKELAKAISGRQKENYKNIIGTYQFLTNPMTNYFSALDNITDKKSFAFFPPSRSKEADLINKYAAKGGIAAGQTMDLLISAVKNGEVSLKPSDKFDGSGWYDYQQFSLEPFLLPEKMPEGKKLFLNPVYKKRLENSFRSTVSQMRETHVKQLESPLAAMGIPPELEIELTVRPDFKIEPMPTFYLRTAQAYAFLMKSLDTPFLNNEILELVEEDAKLDTTLNKPPERVRTQLTELISLFNQFSERSSFDIGLDPAGIKTEAANDFLSGWKNRREMKQDIRVIVPIAPLDQFDPSKGINYWAVLGVTSLEFDVRYDKKPQIKILRKNVKANIEYGTSHYTILVPVFAEVVIPSDAPPTREEFRKICDKYKTKLAILSALRMEK